MYHLSQEQRDRMDELNRRADATRRRERDEAAAIDAEWERVTRSHTPETADAELSAVNPSLRSRSSAATVPQSPTRDAPL